MEIAVIGMKNTQIKNHLCPQLEQTTAYKKANSKRHPNRQTYINYPSNIDLFIVYTTQLYMRLLKQQPKR